MATELISETGMPNCRLLVVDDEVGYLQSLRRALKDDFEVHLADSAAEARKVFAQGVDIALVDICLGKEGSDRGGVVLLREILEQRPGFPVVMISAYGNVDVAVECMQAGAADFIQKPASVSELRQRLRAAHENARTALRARQLEERLYEIEPASIAGVSNGLEHVRRIIAMAARDGHASVLIRGETGTGKELVAQMIHRTGWRASGPMVAVAIAALNPNLMESELFGHEAGSFTGATQRRIGYIEKARDGVLFLDEIADLPQEAQVKLLRFLEERTFNRVGSTKGVSVELQLISATNRDLEKAIRETSFRQDIYYRLKSVDIYIPPLRERIDDIAPLTEHFLKRFRKQGRTQICTVCSEAMNMLLAYSWPGNVRELRAVLERALIFANAAEHGAVQPEDLPDLSTGQDHASSSLRSALPTEGVNLDRMLAVHELNALEAAIRQSGDRKGEAWRLLGLNDRFAVRRRIQSIRKRYPDLIESMPHLRGLYASKKR